MVTGSVRERRSVPVPSKLVALCVMALLFAAGPGRAVQTDVAAAKAGVAGADRAMNAATGALAAMKDALAEVERYTGRLRRLDADTPRTMERLTDHLVATVAPLQEELANSLEALKKAKTELTAVRDKLPADAEQAEGVEQARTACDTCLDNLPAHTKAVEEQQRAAHSTLGSVGTTVATAAELAAREVKLEKAGTIAPDGDIPDVLGKSPRAALTLARYDAELSEQWHALAEAIKKLEADGATYSGVAGRLTALHDAAQTTLNRLPGWLDAVVAYAEELRVLQAELLPDQLRDPVANGAAATRLVKRAETNSASIKEFLKVVEELRVAAPEGFSLPAAITADKLNDAWTGVGLLDVETELLRDGLAGDMAEFVGRQVRLYYYTDIPTLIRILNPSGYSTGGGTGLREAAQVELRKLREADLDLLDAQQKVNDAQTRVLTLREELRLAKTEATDKAAALVTAANAVTALQKDKKEATDRVTAANTRATRTGATATDELALANAKEAEDKADLALSLGQQRQTEAQRESDAAEKRRAALEDEQNGLPGKVKLAEDLLSAAQAAVARQRRAAALTATDESEAFAAARDNQPFYYAMANAASTDPAKKVMLYGFEGSKSLFVRGKRKDVEDVVRLITQFDAPAPQARLTLWTIELNGSADRLNRAFEDIEDELASTRAQVNATLSLLRECVNEEVTRAAADAPAMCGNEAVPARLRRLHFYEDEVLELLGYSKDPKVPLSRAKKLGAQIPDPAATTTLGEALMVLSLAKESYRRGAMRRIESGLAERLARFPHRGEQETVDTATILACTRQALGLDREPAHGPRLTAHQLEIVRALQWATLSGISAVLAREMLDEPVGTKNDNAEYLKTTAETVRDLVLGEFGPPGGGGGGGGQSREAEWLRDAQEALDAAEGERRRRVAAADQMLKELIIAVEDDLDRSFMRPMLTRLRERAASRGVQVGFVQRTSVLATNRRVARVNPRASAQLEVGREQDVLQEAQQAVLFYAMAQTGGLIGAFGLAGLQPKDKPPELYALTTGNVFQVTPIFDPSGQALRFQLDYVAQTQVREPDGTVNPQLPRIERHTVNTDVQLSNLELREVSRFESNAKLGVPTRTSGGIPILNDIPLIKEIPLIGWFSKKKGQAAVAQASLILGQTTMYPTIGDLVGLLSPGPPPYTDDPGSP